MNEITQQKINIYEFPNCADEEENKMTRKLKVCLCVSFFLYFFVCLFVCKLL